MIGYLDLPSGISGDMLLGCLVDAGWPVARLQAVIESLRLPDDLWSVRVEEVRRGPLRAALLDVHTVEEEGHRHLDDIVQLLRASSLPPLLQQRAAAVFTRLAEAEAAVHGATVDQVHFHEVGALDAVIDVVGVVAGLHELGIERLFASALPLGPGWTTSEHGRIPLPAPATLEMLARVHAPTRPAPGPGELVTPTGAALVAELAEFGQPAMRLHAIAVGAGSKEFPWPNVARLWLGEADTPGEIIQIETNIDDMNPELYGAVRTRLVEAGALDVWTTPIQMKKDRPGVLLSVLARAALEEVVVDILFAETTTLGMRIHPVRRHEAERRVELVQTEHGEVAVKLKIRNGAILGVKPEYDDCLQIAMRDGLPVRAVYEAAQTAAHAAWIHRPAAEEISGSDEQFNSATIRQQN